MAGGELRFSAGNLHFLFEKKKARLRRRKDEGGWKRCGSSFITTPVVSSVKVFVQFGSLGTFWDEVWKSGSES